MTRDEKLLLALCAGLLGFAVFAFIRAGRF